MMRVAHKISDVIYELHQTDKKKAKVESIIEQTCQNKKKKDENCESGLEKEIEEWKQYCSVRVSLVAKRDKMQAQVYVVSVRAFMFVCWRRRSCE